MGRLVALGFGLVYSCSAWAHGGLGDTLPFWGSVFHLLASPLSLAALAGGALTLADVGERTRFQAAVWGSVATALAVSAAPALPAILAPAGVSLLGMLALGGWNPAPRTAAWGVGAAAGFLAGVGADLDAPSLTATFGAAIAALFLFNSALLGLQGAAKLPQINPILPIARRVLGSWVAAIGFLLAALCLHQLKN